MNSGECYLQRTFHYYEYSTHGVLHDRESWDAQKHIMLHFMCVVEFYSYQKLSPSAELYLNVCLVKRVVVIYMQDNNGRDTSLQGLLPAIATSVDRSQIRGGQCSI